MFDSFEVHKIIVIGPLRVSRYTWPAEIEKWDHLKGLKYSVAVGTEGERLEALRKQADIYLINRENVQWLISESGIPFDFDMVVIDELSSFKNHQTKRFKALMKVRPKVKRIVGMTGTPSSNGLMDLWAEFRLLDMGERLGRFIGQYRTSYFRPDKQNGQVVFSYKPLPGAEKQIYGKISDITISMKSTDHLKMPELVSSRHTVYLSEDERKRYEDMKAELILQLPEGEVTAANAAALSNKLSQMANGAVYSDDESAVKIHDRKLDALIHPASAGHGLNLQSGGSTIVWFGLTWSLELYQQTNARLWRQGQTAGTVVVQHIIAEDTIDGRIMKALSDKDSTQSALIEAVKADLQL